ncbi:hypothetical protein KFK09_026644 [Dendrobium nobile]|uniref:DUF4283 domain-containing protein n=1 Tax=Dendrobium nobile TaxID=94219 RepID=A0A8T3A8F4_DENNO|nr:hypothetical protein KFK09_026644 [Dendrobium nobile]
MLPTKRSWVRVFVVSPNSKKTWNGLWTSRQSSSKPYSVSFIPSSDDLAHISEEDVASASKKWVFTLVGYSLGKHPYFEALRSVMLKTWKLKGDFTLLALNEGVIDAREVTASTDNLNSKETILVTEIVKLDKIDITNVG